MPFGFRRGIGAAAAMVVLAAASAFFRFSITPARSALPRPLTGGLLRVMTAMPSRTAY